MKKNTSSFALIIALLAVTGVVSWSQYAREYAQEDTVSIHTFPADIGTWQLAEEIPITDHEYAVLETRNAFTRKYTNTENGHSAYLFIVYSQTNRKVSHPPEVCYTGSGVTIVGKTDVPVPIPAHNIVITVNQLLLERLAAKNLTFYWFKVGTSFTSSYWRQQVLIALKTLFRRPSSSALIRVSTDINDNDQAAAAATLTEFTQHIFPHLIAHLP